MRFLLNKPMFFIKNMSFGVLRKTCENHSILIVFPSPARDENAFCRLGYGLAQLLIFKSLVVFEFKSLIQA